MRAVSIRGKTAAGRGDIQRAEILTRESPSTRNVLGKTQGEVKEKLTIIQIQKFYNHIQKSRRIQRYGHIELKNKGLSTRVVWDIYTLLNNCLEQVVAKRLILVNPAKGCKLPKLEKKEMKVPPQEKIGPYLMEADKRGLLAAYYLELTYRFTAGRVAGTSLD